MDLQWDRKFGDGTVAPTGDYEVLLQAWDQLGNGRYITSRIYIPEAGATAVIPLGDVVSGGTFEDTPTPMAQQTQTEVSAVVPAATAATEEAPTPVPEPSSTPSSLSFSSAPIIPASGESKSTTLPVDPNLLTGAAALAAAASATAYSLQRKEEKETERKRQEAESRAEAMAKVREAQLVKEANAFAYNMLKKSGGIPAGDNTTNPTDIPAEDFPVDKDAYENLKQYYLANTTEPMSEEEQLALEKYLLSLSAEAYAAHAEFLANNPEAATMIANQERMKAQQEAAKKTAEEYSNQAKSFHDGESASNASYQQYQTQQFHEKEQDDLWHIQQANLKAFHEKEATTPNEISTSNKSDGGLIDPMNPYGSANYIYHDQLAYEGFSAEPVSEVMREIAISSIPYIGDPIGMYQELKSLITTGKMDGINFGLSFVGAVGDYFPGVGDDAAIAILRGVNKTIPPGPAKEIFGQIVVKVGKNAINAKDPKILTEFVENAGKLVGNQELFKALQADPKIWEYVWNAGPEAIDELIANSDEAILLLKESDIDGIKVLMEGGEVIADSTKKVISNIAELGLDSPENISRVEKLKACGVPDEDIIKVIEDGTPSSTYMQKKILELEDFNYFDDSQRLAVKSAINDGRVDVSTWTGQLSGNLKGLTTEEWAAVNRYMGEGSDVYRIPEDGLTKVGDFIVDGTSVEFKGIKTNILENIKDQAMDYADESLLPIPEGKGADKLVLDCVTNSLDLTLDEAVEIANKIKLNYPEKTVEIWTSFGDIVK